MKLSEEKQKGLDRIIACLKEVDDIIAVVLGGSHGLGLATDSSDLDIGIFYKEDKKFNIDIIRSIAKAFSIYDNPTVTDFYGWGAWVNGGAWITTAFGQVDFIYRNLEQVRTTIQKAQNGEWINDFDQQPPYGFSSIIYLGEVKTCIPLFDPHNIISELKSSVHPYPTLLKEKLIQQSLWSAEFAIWQAEYFAKKPDLYNTMGCLTRIVKDFVTALFAINEIYPLGDKRAIEILENASVKPDGLRKYVENILSTTELNLDRNILFVKHLFQELVELTEGNYHSPFLLKEH